MGCEKCGKKRELEACSVCGKQTCYKCGINVGHDEGPWVC